MCLDAADGTKAKISRLSFIVDPAATSSFSQPESGVTVTGDVTALAGVNYFEITVLGDAGELLHTFESVPSRHEVHLFARTYNRGRYPLEITVVINNDHPNSRPLLPHNNNATCGGLVCVTFQTSCFVPVRLDDVFGPVVLTGFDNNLGKSDADCRCVAVNVPAPPACCEVCVDTAVDVCSNLGYRARPTSLMFKFEPSSRLSNSQSGKASVTRSGAAGVDTTIACGGAYDAHVAQTFGVPVAVSPGDTFVIVPDDREFLSQTTCAIKSHTGTQTVSFHTSCSAALSTEDVFGSFHLVGFDGHQRSVCSGESAQSSMPIIRVGRVGGVATTDGPTTEAPRSEQPGSYGQGTGNVIPGGNNGYGQGPGPGTEINGEGLCEGVKWTGAGLRLIETHDSSAKSAKAPKGGKKGGRYDAPSGKSAKATKSGKKRSRRAKKSTDNFKSGTYSAATAAVVPRFSFRESIAECPDLDTSIIVGMNRPNCGWDGDNSYHCDRWDLTQACTGAAAVPGSPEMANVCSNLCSRVNGCTAYMVDHSFDVQSGFCILLDGKQTAVSSCFFQAGSTATFQGVNNCNVEATTEICSSGNKKKFKSLGFQWQPHNGAAQATITAQGANVIGGSQVAAGEVVTITRHGRKMFGKTVSILIGRQTTKLKVSCKTPLELGAKVYFASGKLVLTSYTTDNGQTEASINSPESVVCLRPWVAGSSGGEPGGKDNARDRGTLKNIAYGGACFLAVVGATFLARAEVKRRSALRRREADGDSTSAGSVSDSGSNEYATRPLQAGIPQTGVFALEVSHDIDVDQLEYDDVASASDSASSCDQHGRKTTDFPSSSSGSVC